MELIDQWAYRSSLRTVNTYAKCFFALSTLLFCVLTRSIYMAIFVLLSMGIVTICIGKTSFLFYLKLFRLPLFFILCGMIALPFYKALQIAITALASVSCLYFLSLSTPMTELISFAKSIHVPSLFIELMTLMYRFIFLLHTIARQLKVSQNARLGYHSLKQSYLSTGLLLSSLLIRSLKQTSELFDSLESRCYTGTLNTLSLKTPINIWTIIFVAIHTLFLIGIYFLER